MDVESIFSSRIKEFNFGLNNKASIEQISIFSDGKVSENEFRAALKNIYGKIDSLQAEIGDNHKSYIGGNNLSLSDTLEMKRKINNFQGKIEKNEEKNCILQGKIEKNYEKINNFQGKLEKSEEKIKDFENSLKKFKRDIKLIKNDIIVKELDRKAAPLQQTENIIALVNKKIDYIIDEEQSTPIIQETDFITNTLLNLKNSLRIIEDKYDEKLKNLELLIKNLQNKIVTNENSEITVKQMSKEIERKLYKEIDNCRCKYDTQIDILTKYVEEIIKNKPGKDEINEILNKFNNRIQAKADILELDKKLLKINQDISELIQQLKNEIKNALLIKDKEILLINEHQPLQTIKSFENIPPVYQIKNLKDDLIKLRAELTQIAKILKEKSSKSELNDYKYLVDKRFQEISKEMLLKASVKDICILLDMKANIEDINIALTDVHKELDLKASIIALNTGINVQNENISVLLSLNSLARWV